MADITKVSSAEDIQQVAALAHEIWTNHYVPIVGQEQVDYMLEMFQSSSAISAQIENGYDYYLVFDGGGVAGYFALVPSPRDSTLLLSKIYIRSDFRGKGLGKAVIEFAEKQCAALGLRTLWLTVNKRNVNSIAFYNSLGFSKESSIVNDIGKGFVMDDFKMVKRVSFNARA